MKSANVSTKRQTMAMHALSNELQTAIIDEIVRKCGDMSTGFFCNNFQDVARYKEALFAMFGDYLTGDYGCKINAGRSMHLVDAAIHHYAAGQILHHSWIILAVFYSCVFT